MQGPRFERLTRLPALRLLAPFATGIALADRLDAHPGTCAWAICAAAAALGWPRARPLAEGLLAVSVGALALALPLSVPQPAVGERLVDLRLLSAPTGWGASCRAPARLLAAGRHRAGTGVEGRVLVEGPPQLCRWLPGQEGRSQVTLERLRGPRNPGAIDWRRRWARRGVRARARVRDSLLAGALSPTGARATLERARRAIGAAVDPRGEPSRAGGLLRALTIGDRTRLGSEVQEAFQRSGTRHLLAISGLHIGWLLGLARALVGALLRRSPVAAWQRRVSGISLAAGALVALAYGALAGLATPTLRALTMAWAGAVAVLGGRPQQSANALTLAALAVLAADPAALFEPGLWLSVLAVTGILIWRPGGGALSRGIGCAAGASLATLPVLAALGVPLPAATLGANAVLVPWVGTVVVPLGLAAGGLGALFGAPIPGLDEAAQAAAEIAIRLAQALESPDLLAGLPHPVFSALGIAVGGLLLRSGLREPVAGRLGARAAGGCLALAGAGLALWPSHSQGDPEVWLFDVGHGDAILVRDREQSWLVDSGPAWTGGDAGRTVVAPALRALGVLHLSALWITHPDRDHLGGARSVLRAFSVGEIRVGLDTLRDPRIRPLAALAARRGIPLRVVASGDRFRLGRLEGRVLWPPSAARSGSPRPHSNDLSLVLRLDAEDGCVWLAGDAPARVDRRLAGREEAQRCAILKLGHHGSATSTDPTLLARLDPDLALASGGRRRRAPLPARAVRARLRRRAITLWTTARFGALRLRLGAPPTVSPWVVEPSAAQRPLLRRPMSM
ncbi:MAG: DNA internalization-related competence protein ComEC/Rec2 [Myxococcota bacterium]